MATEILGGPLRWALGGVLAGLLGAHGLRKRSLSRSGAAAAFVAGTVHFGCGVRFGLVLVLFYYTSSKLTKMHMAKKAKLEEDFKEGGQRTWVQVLCNSAGGAVFASLAAMLSSQEGHAMDGRDPRSTALLAGFLGHYACCCADTWASEVGVLSSHSPRLITTLKSVPTGTNGGVTLLGLGASAIGGLFIGVVFWAADPTSSHQWQVVPLGLMAGLAGSLLDSLLGATVQYSGFCERQKRVVSAHQEGVKHISGLDILDNHGVNALSAALTSLLAAVASTYIF